MTVDHQIAGVHFPEGLDPRRAARRLLAVNLSDLAAVGARPRSAFLALAGPSERLFRGFLDGLVAACREAGVELAGGDLARTERLHASLTVTGELPPRGRWVRRDAARPGDRLWLGGTVGESAAGRLVLAAGAGVAGRGIDLPPELAAPRALARAARRAVRRHLAPRPQLELGAWLGRRRRAAAIDISDGLALDLHRLLEASRVGATLEAERLPLAERAGELAARLGRTALELALTGGEDYVLLFALAPSATPPEAAGCRAIGTVTGGRTVHLRHGGRTRRLEAAGWDHLAS